jgi:YidC/Oxa1 family membrane protein insertase
MIVFMTYVLYQEERRADFLAATEEAEISSTASVADPAADPMSAASAAAAPRSSARPPVPRELAVPVAPAREIELATHTLQNRHVVAKISNGPALIQSWKLREYMERLPDGDVPIELLQPETPVLLTELDGVAGGSFAHARFEVVRQSSQEVVQRAQNVTGILTRTLRLDDEGYGFDLELSFESHRTDPVDARFVVLMPSHTSTRDDFRETSLLAYGDANGVTREFVQGIGQPSFFDFGAVQGPVEKIEGGSTWAGFDSQFFTGLVIDPSQRGRFTVEFETLDPGESAQTRLTLPGVGVGAGGVAVEFLRGFLGPKTAEDLKAGNASLEKSVDRGWSWLEPLTRFFEIALDKLYVFIPNYGLAIIVLTFLVRVVTSPLMLKQMKSAERMREVQPKIKALQERHKDDKQKQSEEMMKFYREEGINPLSGCFPVLLQMPVLIGLFYALRTSIGLRHAPFMMWIDDLSQPATLFTMPGLDFPVRILPLIMGGSMYVQQKMTPQTGMDPVQARMMLIMMPGMMLLISYTFPSGLVLYWTVSNLLGIAQQYWVRNHLQPKS